MIINRREMARSKIEELKNGYSAFAETSEVANFIEKELATLNLDIHVDRTPLGAWFIPVKEQELSHE
jgi:hypothetical protein